MKIIFMLLGTVSLGFGFAGIILPVLPTTPFLILSAYFYSKSSDKINDRFKSSKIYKNHLEDFITNKTMTRKQKWVLLIAVDLMLLISFISINSLFLRIVIIVLFLFKHWYFYRYVKIKK
jgi:uncharacterized membrane protein YbaN (DUF454 family)